VASWARVWEPKHMHRMTVTALVAATLALAACSSPSGGEVTPLASVTQTPHSAIPSSASASPTPTPEPDDVPSPATTPVAAQGDPCADPSASITGLAGIDFNRYARICLGMSFAEASAAMLGPAIAGESMCPWYAVVLAVDDPGLYVAAVSRLEDPGAEIFLFRMTWQADPADAAAFGAPATAAGLSVGSTPGEIKAAHPQAVSVTIDDPSRGPRNQLVVAGPDATSLVFDVTEGVVTDMYWGKGISQGAVAELCAL